MFKVIDCQLLADTSSGELNKRPSSWSHHTVSHPPIHAHDITDYNESITAVWLTKIWKMINCDSQ